MLSGDFWSFRITYEMQERFTGSLLQPAFCVWRESKHKSLHGYGLRQVVKEQPEKRASVVYCCTERE